MPKVIKSAGRDIILKIKRACEEERDNNGVGYSRPVPDFDEGVSERTEWLTKNGIEFKNCLTKAQLYELIKRHKGYPQYEIEQLLNEHGHKVLRLPPYHCDLNPIEKIWAIAKRLITEKNVAQAPKEIAAITEAAFRTVTTEEWLNVCLHVEKIEEKYFESERLMDVEMDKFIINVTGDTSDSSDEDCSMDSDEDVRMED